MYWSILTKKFFFSFNNGFSLKSFKFILNKIESYRKEIDYINIFFSKWNAWGN